MAGWISQLERRFLDVRYRSSEILVKRMVERSAAEEVLKTIEGYANRYRYDLQWGAIEHNIKNREVSLPNRFVPVTKLQLKGL